VHVHQAQTTRPVKLHQMFDKYFYTYVLRSLTDLKFYVGFTSNLMQRFEAHNSGKVSSTKNRIPFELVYFEGCQSKEDAMHREKYLKTFYGKMFLKNRLKSYLTG
jgi:putative endonuclease